MVLNQLLILTSLGKARINEITFSSDDKLVSFLSIPFCCEDIGVIEAARILLESDNRRNVPSFINKSRASQNPTTLLNSARTFLDFIPTSNMHAKYNHISTGSVQFVKHRIVADRISYW